MRMLTAVTVLGLAAFFTASAVRRLPLVDRWTLSGVKPWACNLCMALWTSLGWTLVARDVIAPAAYLLLAVTWMASAGVCLITLEWSESLTPESNPPPPPSV